MNHHRPSPWTRPAPLLAFTFLGLIALGTIALLLPATQGPEPLGVLDAIFLSTSAVCVTGLTTVEGGAASLPFAGQVVILVLIQLGGLGIMTYGTFAAQILRRRVSFSSQAALQDVIFQTEHGGRLPRLVREVFALVLAIELVGVALLYPAIAAEVGHGARAWFDAAFTSVSGFCNAGFSVYADSAMSFRDAPLFLFTLMALITFGGLGYAVVLETLRRWWTWLRRRPNAYVRASLNTRVVWLLSAVLTLGGAGLLFASGLTASEETLWERGLHALFQSVTARTAGFNTIDVGALPLASLLLLIPLMFVGGSPASCAGGVKTTSLGIWAARVVTRLRGREDVNILERHIPHEIVRRATLVIAVAVVWITLGVFILVLTESGANPHFALEDLIFEQVSAFATVGLSTGITSELTPLGKIWIILSMFVGRLGPLTVALVVMQPHREQVHYPTERVMVG